MNKKIPKWFFNVQLGWDPPTGSEGFGKFVAHVEMPGHGHVAWNGCLGSGWNASYAA